MSGYSLGAVKLHILIAEDDLILSDGLTYFLRKRGHSALLASDGAAAVQAVNTEGIDLLVLDFGLLKATGREVLTEFRARNPGRPVLLISARDDACDRVRRMGLTVDGFLPKPFGLKEFDASISRLTQQPSTLTPLSLRLGPLTFDPANGVMRLGADVLALPPQEQSLLELLIKHATRPTGNEEFADRLSEWRDQVGHAVAESQVSYLRQRLEDSGLQIVLVRGLGYRMVEAKTIPE